MKVLGQLESTNLNAIKKFQIRVKTLINLKKDYNRRLNYCKKGIISMVSNLNYFTKINVFMNSNLNFFNFLQELKEIDTLLKKLPAEFYIKNIVKDEDKEFYLNIINDIINLQIKYSNHICYDNLYKVLDLFGTKNWRDNFSKDDLEKLDFIKSYFTVMCVWDSEKHKNGVPMPEIDEPKRKNALNAKDLLDTLIGNGPSKSSSIIVGDSSMPGFLKSINEVIASQKEKKPVIRDNEFKKIECIGILNNNKVVFTKNTKSNSLYEDKFGACVYLKLSNSYLVIQGIFTDDILNISKNIKFVDKKYKEHKSSFGYNLLEIPKTFKNNYLKIMNLRDIVVCTPNEICDDVKKKYNDFKSMVDRPLLPLINQFLLASKFRKLDILTLLLMSGEDDQKLAYVLYDVLKNGKKSKEATEVYESLHHSIRELLDNSKKLIEEDEEKLEKLSSSDIPYERRISMLKTDEDVKTKAMEKLKSMKNSFQGDNKAQGWLDGLLKLPFGSYSDNEILSFKENFIKKLAVNYPDEEFKSDNNVTLFLKSEKYLKSIDNDNFRYSQGNEPSLDVQWNNYLEERAEYLDGVKNTLDSAVYGHTEAKVHLQRIFAQWINGESKGAVLGFHGPPGTGKTSLAKNGLSKCLVDKDGKPRPFAFLPIGGSVNGSTLVGHNFTYVGSTWGRICDILMTCKCMNPIIFIDEIDKVSATEHGREIISILTHLTDSTQNDEFEDKYFSGIKLDLSKALIVFSFNDISLIDPILRDRITIIETKPLTIQDKEVIIQDYMLPSILKEVGFTKGEVNISNKTIREIVSTYTNEAGVRKIKELIQELVRDVNMNRFSKNSTFKDFNFEIPFEVNEEYLKLLFEGKPKLKVKGIPENPTVGIVNGLYATTTGIGGLTMIQIIKYPSDKFLELTLTGKQGDVMKESVEYAKRIAFSLLSMDDQIKLVEDAKNKKSFGLHVHTPEAATPKDGPSAGAAMTLAIYSVLSNKKVNNTVAMTGEIDLCKNVTAIGGVGAKLNGAKRAGAKKALIPEENLEDLEKLRREGISPEDDDFKVITIKHIDDVLKHCIVSDTQSKNCYW